MQTYPIRVCVLGTTTEELRKLGVRHGKILILHSSLVWLDWICCRSCRPLAISLP